MIHLPPDLSHDQYNIVGQVQPDGFVEGGDSTIFTGLYVYLSGIEYPYRATFEKGFGGYVRHPHPSQSFNGFAAFYRNPWTGVISRDQMTGIFAGLISQRDRAGAWRQVAHHACSLFLFSYNSIINGQDPIVAKRKFPDLTGPDIWAMHIRATNLWIAYPLLLLFDLHLLAGAAVVRLTPDNDDNIATITKLFIALDHMPTPWSKLALKVFSKKLILDKMNRYCNGWRKLSAIYKLIEKKVKSL